MVRRTWIWLLPVLALCALSARADSFGRIYYDKKNNQLVVTMIYRGTNPNHDFTLKWGECHGGQAGVQEVAVEVLDDQFQDRALQNFRIIKNFPLDGLPCRPAKVTLRTAPRFFYTLTIPG